MAGAYYDPNQGIGYSSTPFGVGRPQSGYDITMRRFLPNALDYGPMGLLRDNSRLKDRIEGNAPSAPNNAYSGSGSSSFSFSGGRTSSDPGAYNWDTYTKNLDRVVGGIKGAIDYRMENKRLAKAKAAKNKYMAAQNATASLWAQKNPLVPGASSPVGGRKNAPVNLLTTSGPTSAATPPPLPATSAPKSRTQARKGAAKNATPKTNPAKKP